MSAPSGTRAISARSAVLTSLTAWAFLMLDLVRVDRRATSGTLSACHDDRRHMVGGARRARLNRPAALQTELVS
jgi:hypothetical protein